MRTFAIILTFCLLGSFLFFTDRYEINQLTGYLKIEGCERFSVNLPKEFHFFGKNEIKPIYDSNFNRLSFIDKGITKLPEDYFKNINCVEELLLKGNYLNHLPLTIKDLKQLKILIINQNPIKQTPINFFENNTELETVNLSQNSIKNLEIPYFENLKYYDLSRNKIENYNLIKPSKKKTNITSINLTDNYLYSIPYTLAEVQNLQELNISNNQLESTKLMNSDSDTYSSSLLSVYFDDLLLLDLSRNQIREMPEVLNAFPQLESLDLSYNKLVELIHLKGYYRLRSLNLSNQAIDSIKLDGTHHLNILNAYNNTLGHFELLKPHEKLHYLYLHENELNDIPDLTNAPNLEYLNLSLNYLSGDVNFSAIPHIKEVNLMKNKFTKIPAIQYKGNSKIKNLNLSHNQIKTLNLDKFPTSLEVLDISSNKIKTFKANKKHPNLMHLKIPFNGRTNLSVSFLKKIPRLQLLEIDSSFSENEGVLAQLKMYCDENNIEIKFNE